VVEIRLAKNSGFCFGVKRAIRLAEETATKYGKATTIGPIIHNPQVVAKLSVVGVNPIDDLSLIQDEPVIIRSHGIPVDTLLQLQSLGVDIVDATCPYVAKAHEFARAADKENYEIIIMGNPSHPEIIALKSYISSKVTIWEKPADLNSEKFSKVAVICQTTQNNDNLIELATALLPLSNEVRIFNTICSATDVRQQSSLQLAKDCSLMIVIGGKNSSNTLMLAKLCSKYTETKHIEEAHEVEGSWLDDVMQTGGRVGLTAGASTPDWIIIEIYNKIKGIVGDNRGVVDTIDHIPGYQEEPNEYQCSK
jgi:4-hydroxy-3-methylbut-2-enyl diphosphate reductase